MLNGRALVVKTIKKAKFRELSEAKLIKALTSTDGDGSGSVSRSRKRKVGELSLADIISNNPLGGSEECLPYHVKYHLYDMLGGKLITRVQRNLETGAGGSSSSSSRKGVNSRDTRLITAEHDHILRICS